MRFFVDNYQRGYKLEPEQVKALLHDIAEFQPLQGGFYCLQPIVVKYKPGQQNCKGNEVNPGFRIDFTNGQSLKILYLHSRFSMFDVDTQAEVTDQPNTTDWLRFANQYLVEIGLNKHE